MFIMVITLTLLVGVQICMSFANVIKNSLVHFVQSYGEEQ